MQSPLWMTILISTKCSIPIYRTVYKRKNRRASRALCFLVRLHQATVLDGLHGGSYNNHGIISVGHRFRSRFVGVVEEVW